MKKCKLAVIQRGNKGTHASLTGSTIFSMAKAMPMGQPEVHLGDSNHTDTLITPSTLITKHTHKKQNPSHLRAILGSPYRDGASGKGVTARRFLFERQGGLLPYDWLYEEGS